MSVIEDAKKTETIKVRVDEDTKKEIRSIAGNALSRYVRDAIAAAIRRDKKRKNVGTNVVHDSRTERR